MCAIVEGDAPGLKQAGGPEAIRREALGVSGIGGSGEKIDVVRGVLAREFAASGAKALPPLGMANIEHLRGAIREIVTSCAQQVSEMHPLFAGHSPCSFFHSSRHSGQYP